MRNWVVQESIIWKAQAQARFWLRVEAQSFENSGLVIFCSKGQTLFCQCRKLLLATKNVIYKKVSATVTMYLTKLVKLVSDRYWFRLMFSVLLILTPISYSSLHYCLYSSECHGSFSLLHILLLTWRWVYLKHLVVFCLRQNVTQSVYSHTSTTSWSEYTFLWLLLCCFHSLQASVSSSFISRSPYLTTLK